MRLDAPAVERAIRRRVREEVARSPGLRKEHRRNLKVRLRPAPYEKALFPFMVTLLAMGIAAEPRHAAMALPLVVLVSAAAACHWAHRIQGGLFHSSDLAVLMHLPIANETFVRFEWGRIFRLSLWILALGGGVMAAYVAGLRQPPMTLAWVLGAAVLHWLLLLSAALAMVLFRPGWPHQLIGWLFRAAAFATIIAFVGFPSSFPSVGTGWMLLLPSGWIPYVLDAGILGHSHAALAAHLPAAAGACLLPWLHRRLVERYNVNEISRRVAPSPEAIIEATLDREMAVRSEYDPDLVESPGLKPMIREELFRHALPDLLERRVRSRAFLAGIDWSGTGPLERRFAGSLTARERLVADLVLVSPPAWSRRWITGLAITAAGLLVTLRPGPAPSWGFFLAAVGTLTACPVFGGTWRGFKLALSAGFPLPVFGAFPVRPGEILSVVRRANAIRWAAWAPVFLVAAWLLTRRIEDGFAAALKVGLIAAAAAPWMFIMQFNGTMQSWGRGRLFLANGATLALLVAWIVGALLLFVSDPPWAPWLGAAFLLLSLPARAIAVRNWGRGPVDWVGVIRP